MYDSNNVNKRSCVPEIVKIICILHFLQVKDWRRCITVNLFWRFHFLICAFDITQIVTSRCTYLRKHLVQSLSQNVERKQIKCIICNMYICVCTSYCTSNLKMNLRSIITKNYFPEYSCPLRTDVKRHTIYTKLTHKNLLAQDLSKSVKIVLKLW